MRRLSSSLTFFYKRIFPCIWLGFVLLFPVVILTYPPKNGAPVAPFLLVPLMLAFLGGVLFWKLIWVLVDEVWLDGDRLLIKNSGQQATIALTDVINVNVTAMTNPRRITLRLRTQSRFGRTVAFMPAVTHGFMNAFRPDPIAEALIDQIDALRQGRR